MTKSNSPLALERHAGMLSKLLLKAYELHQKNHLREAEMLYRAILTTRPQYCDALTLLGTLRLQQGNPEECITLLERSLEMNPKQPIALNNLGNALQEVSQYESAWVRYDEAIALKSDYVEAYYNCGNALKALKRYDEALERYNKALLLDPNCAAAHWNKGCFKLLLGDYEEGWKLYEWRWKAFQKKEATQVVQPLWLGQESLEGKTILLYIEQGHGDVIQFCRYVSKVEDLGAKVILRVPKSLSKLV